ncbi:DB module domain-containing protein [Ditylenchus destructor]|nr:DB module domain-containing protein [Ditylenchus destructor]
MPYSTIKMNPAFTLFLFVVLSAFVQDSHSQLCPCSPLCPQSLSPVAIACCLCATKCYVDYYRCITPCNDAPCIIQCGEENANCARRCLNIDFESCCQEKGVNIGLPCNYTAILQPSALDRSSSALLTGQEKDRSTSDYLMCMTRGEDNTQCCREAGVSDDCLEMCKPLNEHRDIRRCATNSPPEMLNALNALARCSSSVEMPFIQ